jgi:HNH endonuclease
MRRLRQGARFVPPAHHPRPLFDVPGGVRQLHPLLEVDPTRGHAPELLRELSPHLRPGPLGRSAGGQGRLVKRGQACLCGVWGCQRHKPAWGWASKKNKPIRDRAYTDPAYRRIRREILSKRPPCSVPGCIRPATTLDHILAVSLGGGNEPSNLRPMCRKHNQDLGRDLGNQMKRQKRRA